MQIITPFSLLSALTAGLASFLSCATVGCVNGNKAPSTTAEQIQAGREAVQRAKEAGVKGYFFAHVEDPNVYTKTEFGVGGAEVVIMGEIDPEDGIPVSTTPIPVTPTKPAPAPGDDDFADPDGPVTHPPTIPTVPVGGK